MAGESVLIVDDTPLNLKLLELLLTTRGFAVRSAITAESALGILETYDPALMILDLRLPGMSGIELCKVLRANPKYDGTVIVAVTASAMKGDDEKALSAGFDGYVTKPVDTRAFPGVIAGLMARKRAATS
jgi:two-component system, cell cycle response regulator DivK